MKPRAVDFVSYNVTDMARSEAFYRDVLGLDVAVPWGGPGRRFPEFQAGGTTISLTQLPQLPMQAIVALAVDDVRGALEELRGKDVKVVMDTYETEVCYMALVADPDGNQILLHQRKDGSAG
jgi:predicted enzyme related to lactoylglutathione lyase